MLETNYPKLTLSSQEARDAVPLAIWTGEIAEALTDAEIAGMRAVSKDFNSIMSDGTMWMDKLTLLSLTHTGLSDLAKGEQETFYAWYTRCLGAARDGETLARKHLANEQPYLQAFGTVNSAEEEGQEDGHLARHLASRQGPP